MEIEQENVIQQNPIQQGGGRFGQFGQFQPKVRQQKPKREYLDYGRPKIVARPQQYADQYETITVEEFRNKFGENHPGRLIGSRNLKSNNL